MKPLGTGYKAIFEWNIRIFQAIKLKQKLGNFKENIQLGVEFLFLDGIVVLSSAVLIRK